MDAGRKANTLPHIEKAEPEWTGRCTVSTRNLRKSELGGVIFGCKNYTIAECKKRSLFGLPSRHYSYVRNATPGMVLFLFNCSDRKLHGIYEAISPGRLNIDPYAWTAKSIPTDYPAQVQVRVRSQCRPLMEEQFAPVIAENYYDPINPNLFWFELDRTQTSKLVDLFSSATLPGRSLQNTLLVPDIEAIADNRGKGPDLKGIADIPVEKEVEWETWEDFAASLKQDSESSYMPVPNCANNSSPPKSWSCLFKTSAASESVPKGNIPKLRTSKQVPFPDSGETVHGGNEWETGEGFDASLEQEGASSYAAVLKGTDTSLLQKSQHPQTSAAFESLPKGKILKTQTSELVPLSDKSYMKLQASRPSSPLHREVQSYGGCADEWDIEVSDVPIENLDHASEPNSEWKSSCIPLVSPLEGSWDNDTRYTNSILGNCWEYSETQSCNLQSEIYQLMQELEELKASQLKQNSKISSLEQQLVQSKVETQNLRKQVKIFTSMATSSSSGYSDKGYDPSALSNDIILVIGGTDGSSWLSDFCMYSTTFDLVKALEPMTFPRSFSSAAQLNGEVFLFGGVHDNIWYDTAESYNLMHDQWVTRPSLNQKKGSLAGIPVYDNLYAIGGGNGVDCFSEVELLDMNIGKWIFTKSMQQKRFGPTVATVNGVLYVVGGYDGSKYLSSVERFDPREPRWTEIESLSTPKGCHSLAALNEKLYALGGYDGQAITSTVEIFDPRVGSWMMGEPMQYPRGYSAAVVTGGKIYAIGGVNRDQDILDSVRTVEYYQEGCGWAMASSNALGKRSFCSALVL
ncbi:OLC1v1001409C1 [Oldenlandia corymbosa var. corymbosa]|uniref:OLC1v1001409C1 n=1 Tax=Oldenlandia corymbosa var. corymbosa TaxID=529605 RepID=A0AAV1D578_OLDCO|nr:OLC1v1001409C1 [Oldenlandia corymbosa var. corymbosa]